MSRKEKRRAPKKSKERGEPIASAPERESGPAAYHVFPGPWPVHAAVLVLFLLGTCLLYAGDLDLGFFHLDDTIYVENNPWIRSVSYENVAYVLTQPYFYNYSPVHLLSYMVDHVLSGGDPWAFHLSSNLWAGLVAWLVYLVGLALTGRFVAGLVAAILFAVHPAHVEAVVWISSRKDLVAAAFALPAIVAYFGARRASGSSRTKRYLLSLLFFTLATAGKLSVALVPGILLAFDLLVERRRDGRLILDKVPYGLIVLFFARRAMAAQPETHGTFEPFVLAQALGQNLVLLSGFGEYTLQRPPPHPPEAAWAWLVGALVLAAAFALPGLLGRRSRSPYAALVYWVLLALIPAQVLSFVHPVTDRYLFFPSVGVTLLLGVGANRLWETRGPAVRAAVVAVLAVLAAAWARTTLAYVAEWGDPRSVWYAASERSNDVTVFQYLGTHYQNAADRVPGFPGARPRTQAELRDLARLVWKDDPRLDELLAAWDRGESPGPATRGLQETLWALAAAEFDRAVAVKGTRSTPNLFFRRGKLARDRGDLTAARREFEAAYDESLKHTAAGVRDELAVRCRHALGVIEWREGDYETALTLLRRAEEEQARAGRLWIPELSSQRERLEELAGR